MTKPNKIPKRNNTSNRPSPSTSTKIPNNKSTKSTSPKSSSPKAIEDDFQIVTRSRRTSTSSKSSTISRISAISPSNSSSSSARSSTPNGDETKISASSYKYVIRNIPNQFSTQRELYKLLRPTALQIIQLKANFNKTALVECSTPAPSNFQKTLQELIGTPTISFESLRKNNHQSSSNLKAPRKTSYSCVVKFIPLDYSIEEIEDNLKSYNISFHKCWRIISMSTNKPTSLIRVITFCKNSIDKLLINGFPIYGRIHEVKPSKVPPLLVKYCSTCQKTDHMAPDCQEKPACASCGENHRSAACPSIKNPKCPNCKGNHPA
ncbi:hypothetical protein HHI36_003739 [Cryptolaemus montrouzieri]|uniref:CCHC-type domain-containing protein n=1 Tax=Cryptolaemus montrouzieri TaxID=559131 RepID=A0ABD2PE95_9CUCU